MIPKELYDFLEENGKADYVNVIKNELKEGVENGGKYRDAKRDLEAAQKVIEEFAPFGELIKAENLTVESIGEALKKSRAGETDLEKFRRELDTYKSQVSTLTKTLEERDSKLTEAQKKAKQTELKGVFAKVLEPLNPAVREMLLENSLANQTIMYDTEGQPKGQIDGVYYEPKQFGEKFIAANPDLVVKKSGASSDPGNIHGKNTNGIDIDKMTPAQLFELSHQQQNNG